MSAVWNWKSVTPSSIEANQVEYDIQDWVCLLPYKLSTDRTVPEEVKDNIVKLVKPLQSLYFNSTSQSWHYKENCKCCLASSLEKFVTNSVTKF